MIIMIALPTFKMTAANTYELGSLIFSLAWLSVPAMNIVRMDKISATSYANPLTQQSLSIRIP